VNVCEFIEEPDTGNVVSDFFFQIVLGDLFQKEFVSVDRPATIDISIYESYVRMLVIAKFAQCA